MSRPFPLTAAAVRAFDDLNDRSGTTLADLDQLEVLKARVGRCFAAETVDINRRADCLDIFTYPAGVRFVRERVAAWESSRPRQLWMAVAS